MNFWQKFFLAIEKPTSMALPYDCVCVCVCVLFLCQLQVLCKYLFVSRLETSQEVEVNTNSKGLTGATKPDGIPGGNSVIASSVNNVAK